MLRLLFALFIVLHGLVHLLYLGQSRRWFELQPGLAWPDGSWAFSWLLGEDAIRGLTAVLLAVAALGFVAGGVGLLFRQPWWPPVVVATAVYAAGVYLLCWDGGWQDLDEKGAVGLLINLGIITTILLFQWPDV